MKACSRRSRLLTLALALALPLAVLPAAAQTQKPPAGPAPSTAKPSTAKPSSAKPAQPAAKPAATPAPPEPAKPPAPPPPQDVRYKSTYTNGEMKTESVTFIKGGRERFEFQDMILLKQPDQKRTIQISRSANTYLVSPDGMPAPAVPGAAPVAPPKPPGVIMVATTIVDTGERKPAFGQQARRVKVMIDKQPMAGACDTSKQRIETDGWYIDAPPTIATRSTPEQAPPPSPDACADQIQATSNGDPKVLGFPIAYTTTITGDDGKPMVSTMEVTEYEATTLDAALFEVPSGLSAAMNIRELSKALSDANEAKLVAATAAPPAAPSPKTPGVVRIAVPEFTNKTTQTVDTRALRQRLISDLTEAKFEAVPLPATTPADVQARAKEIGADYVLLAEVSELKVNKPSKLGGLMGAATGAVGGRGGLAGAAAGAAANAATAPKENTESSIAVKLVQPDGKQRLSTTTKGKDGSGFSLKSGLGIAKFAGGMYLSMMAGPMMLSRMSSMGAFNNMGGMGMLGNPWLYRMQGAGLSGVGRGMGMDATAGAAAYMMQTAMTMDSMGGFVGVPGQGPSYDESLGEAVQNAAQAVEKALQKK